MSRFRLLPLLLLPFTLAGCGADGNDTWGSCTKFLGETQSHLSNVVARKALSSHTSSEYAAVLHENSAWALQANNRLAGCTEIAIAQKRTKQETAPLDDAVLALSWLSVSAGMDSGSQMEPAWQSSRDSLLKNINDLEAH